MSIVNDLVMASFIIEGGHRLQGEITPQGAKNEVLQILCATLLTPEKVTVRNVPDILDVNNLISMLRSMGVEVEHLSGGEFSFCARNIDEKYLDSDEFLKLCSSLRGSVMLMGPLLARKRDNEVMGYDRPKEDFAGAALKLELAEKKKLEALERELRQKEAVLYK